MTNNINLFGKINHFLQVELFQDLHKGKNIVTLHNPPPFSPHNNLSNIYDDHMAMLTSLLFMKRYQSVLRKSDYIIANSIYTEEGILSQRLNIDNVKVINLGVDSNFSIKKSYHDRPYVIGYIGSYARHKRVEKMILDYRRDYKLQKKYDLKLYGPVVRRSLKLKHHYANDSHIRFYNSLGESIISALNNMRAFFFPSKRESFGLPIIEALACGVPVFIYQDAEITPEVRKYCIPVKSIAEIAEYVEQIDSKMFKISAAVKKEFNWDKTYYETKKIYNILNNE
jgi:glycosyltransferase involved in cell wall biosynthesis